MAGVLAGWIGLARGLAQMHRRGLWHGDPSLGNVVLQPDGRMSWIDFGLLGHQGGGTPGFMAPETLRGQGGAAADMFGLACVMGADVDREVAVRRAERTGRCPQCKPFILGRWDKALVESMTALFWPLDPVQDAGGVRRKRQAWVDWLYEQFRGRAGATVRELW